MLGRAVGGGYFTVHYCHRVKPVQKHHLNLTECGLGFLEAIHDHLLVNSSFPSMLSSPFPPRFFLLLLIGMVDFQRAEASSLGPR